MPVLRARRSLVLALCLLVAGPAFAQDSSTVMGSAAVEIAEPSVFQNLGDLDFADIAVAALGTATINPNTGALTTTGGVDRAGGTPTAALFAIWPAKRGAIFIDIPRAPVILTRESGTETVSVSNWTLSSVAQPVGSGRYKIVAGDEVIQFKIGGTLSVPDNPTPGSYVGTFEVTLENL